MNTARYIVAVTMLVTVPIGLGLWYLIHPFARAWRRVGPAWTYAILTMPAIVVAAALIRHRHALLWRDLGTNVFTTALAVPIFAVGILVSRARRRHLTQRMLNGIPELSARDKGQLLTEGIYGRMRNPRYLEFLLFVLAYVSFANYAGTWVLFALCFPAIHGVVLLEERELRDRFGEQFEAYCRRVPRYVPRRGAVSPAA